MFKLAPSFGRHSNSTSRASSPASLWRTARGEGEQKSTTVSPGHANDTNRGAPWIPQPVRHPFQFASTFRTVSTPPSISSDSPLHPTSRFDLATPAPTRMDLGGNSLQPERRVLTPSTFISRHSEHSLWLVFIKHKKLAFTFLLVPLPVALSTIYLTIGHAILERAAHFLPSSPYTIVPLISSVKAGATGGAVLTIPLIVAFHLLYFLSIRSAPQSSGPDDFFDDESALGPRELWMTWRGVLGCIFITVLMVFMGSFSGPLGSVCLASADAFDDMLAPPEASKAGVVGGLVLFPAIAVLTVACLSVLRRKHAVY